MDETPTDDTPGFTPGPTGPAPAGPPDAARNSLDTFFNSVRRSGLVRSDERWIGGVAGGLALRLGVDPLIVRGLFAVGSVLGGLGFVLYGVGWLLLPEQRDGRIHLQQLIHGDFDAAAIGGFALLLSGFAFPGTVGPFGWGNGSDWSHGFVGLVAVGVIIAVIVSSTSRNRPGDPRTTGPTTWSPRTPPGAPPFFPPGAPTPPGFPPAGPDFLAPQYRPEGQPMDAPPATRTAYGTPAHPSYARPATYGPPVPPQPWPAGPPVPPRHRHRGPGGRVVGIVVAFGLFVLAGLMFAERVGAFDGPVLLTATAVLVMLCGIGIIVAGGMGRTSGGLGAIALVSIFLIAPTGAALDVSWDVSGTFVGEATFVPTDVATAEHGYDVGAGSIVLDLTQIPTNDQIVHVPVNVGAGEVTVILPGDGAYTADVHIMVGEFTWLDDPVRDGINIKGAQEYESTAVQNGAQPTIALDITVGAGDLTVEEES